MRWLAPLIALAGCNQAFGLDDTRLVDAAPVFFDAPPQPPPGCPAIGTPIVFGHGYTQAVAQNCRQFMPSFSSQLTLAVCTTDGLDYLIHEGRLDHGMVPAKFDVDCVVNRCYQIRTTPEGSDAFLSWFDMQASVAHFDRFHRGPDGRWANVGPFTVPFGGLSSDDWSQPSRGPERHMIVFVPLAKPVRELVATEPYETWTEIAQYNYSEFGVTTFFAPRLSPDGLRMVINGFPMGGTEYEIMQSERPTINDRFGVAKKIEGVPKVEEAVLSEDCDRMYFHGLESIFYVTRTREP
jgi:hypothetical protein